MQNLIVSGIALALLGSLKIKLNYKLHPNIQNMPDVLHKIDFWHSEAPEVEIEKNIT